MSAPAAAVEQITVLRHKAEQVEELAREDAGPGWFQALEDAVLDLSNALPEGTEDYDARKLFEFLVALRRALAAGRRGDVELAALSMRDVATRIARRLEHGELDDPRTAAEAVFATLRGVGVSDLGRLLGVSTKTVNTWRNGGPVSRNAERVVVLAQLLSYLRSSLTPVGLVMWFDAPREQLGGRTPLELLDEHAPSAREALVALARGARGQLAG